MNFEILIVVIFILGYVATAIEHTLKVDKFIPVLLMMAFAWALVAFGLDTFKMWFDSDAHKMVDGFEDLPLHGHGDGHGVADKGSWLETTLLHHFGKTSEILFFLVGAMTIVEIIDKCHGFSTIKNFVRTNKKRTLLWIVGVLAFILSSIIDNLAATIVLITILRKLVNDKQARIWYAGLIIISANAGGAWSPIGDVTTTMLWMGDKVSTVALIEYIILLSITCMVVPVLIASFMPAFRGEFDAPEIEGSTNKMGPTMLFLGLTMIVFVPIFKTVTHLPPYVGMMLSLGVVALVVELVRRSQFSLTNVSEEVDAESHGGTIAVQRLRRWLQLKCHLFYSF